MTGYHEEQLLRLAKRHHNTKRSYLLVNPLQGKHIPVSPASALAMMEALGEQMATVMPDADLVVGFAETATAVAAVAASQLGVNCRYIQTTRETFPGGEAVEFREEHSHAVEQRLCLSRLRSWIDEAHAVAFVDDELSTGRTLMNVVDRLCAACPALEDKPILAASIISRLPEAMEHEWAGRNVRGCALLRMPPGDYSDAVAKYDIVGAQPPTGTPCPIREIDLPPATGDPREGVALDEWLAQRRECADTLARRLAPGLQGGHVTVLGTEESMLPALLLGYQLEAAGVDVRFHATTRSPIGVCQAKDYPIQSGWRLHSFYEMTRPTYIYNLQPCDAAIVFTDSPNAAATRAAAADMARALGETDCRELTLIREACHVQHL